jgi:hypothetical protein
MSLFILRAFNSGGRFDRAAGSFPMVQAGLLTFPPLQPPSHRLQWPTVAFNAVRVPLPGGGSQRRARSRFARDSLLVITINTVSHLNCTFQLDNLSGRRGFVNHRTSGFRKKRMIPNGLSPGPSSAQFGTIFSRGPYRNLAKFTGYFNIRSLPTPTRISSGA